MPAEEANGRATTRRSSSQRGGRHRWRPLDPLAVGAVPAGAYVVAADGGLDHALAAGLTPDALVGDLDSVSAGGLAWAREHAMITRTPPTRPPPTPSSPSPGPSPSARAASSCSPAPATGSTTRSPRSARSAPRPSTHLAAVEAWWGADHLHVATPGRPVTLDVTGGHHVLGARDARPGVRRHDRRRPLAARRRRAPAPLVGWGVSNEVLDTARARVRRRGRAHRASSPTPSRSGAAP